MIIAKKAKTLHSLSIYLSMNIVDYIKCSILIVKNVFNETRVTNLFVKLL